MTEWNDTDGTTGRMKRRTLLKGVAAAGVLGTGLTGSASAHDSWRELTLCATGDEVFSYHVKVSDGVKRGGTHQSDEGDELTELSVRGKVAEGRCDSFLIEGEIKDTDLDGPGKVKVDGEVVEKTGDGGHDHGNDGHDHDDDEHDHDHFHSGPNCPEGYWWDADREKCREHDHENDGHHHDDDGKLDRIAVVSSPDTDEVLDYAFEVTGGLEELEPNEDGGVAVDSVSKSGGRVRVEGAVSTGDDRFAFSGDLIRVDVPDGVEIDVSHR